MPDQEVLINDSNLNAIANAIRRKNGLVRTYKPREMAPAIRAINADAPDSREYTVTVIQTPHQTIKVRQVLGGEKQYDQSFTVSEPYWKIQATVEADAGYVAGGLNYPNEVTVDRDITIKATPATEIEVPPDNYVNLYWIGTTNNAFAFLETEENKDNRVIVADRGYNRNYEIIPKPQSRNVYCVYCPLENGLPWLFGSVFTTHNYKKQFLVDATDVIFDFQNKPGLVNIGRPAGLGNYGLFQQEDWLENIQFKDWDTKDVESIQKLAEGLPRLKSIGDISNWDTSSLITVKNLVVSSRYFRSLDLSGWSTPKLEVATNIFTGDYSQILDISNWNTTNITQFSAGIHSITEAGILYPAYLIMDKEEVKFSGNYIFGNIANCKYLVPEDMVDAYKQHPNWASRASQIESITNYTINRGDGQIEVVPNW